MKIIFEPIQKHLKELDEWLFNEKNKGISQTYSNFACADFTNNNFAGLLNENDEAVGYVQYWFSGKYTSIDIAIIKKEYQKKGFGKLLLDKVTENLMARGTLVLKLYCEPHSSKKIWKKLGFKEFKEIEQHQSLNSKNFGSPWLYKTLVPTLKPTRKKYVNKKIELWTELEYKVKADDEPTYIWDVTEYKLPIIYPVDNEWKLRFSINNEIKYEGVVKRFNHAFSDGDFLIIDKR